MLRLLLDEQISPDVAEWFHRRHDKLVVFSLAGWEGGRFMGQPDELLLREAAAQKLTLVTYDRKTIPPLLKMWAEAHRAHGGVIFVDNKTIPSSDIGGLIRALQKLSRESAKWDWSNRICFLRQ
ncbi:MAG TPA: hypothetical protein VMR33_16335 [Candidatus Baltobacteraceae bacterium]|jgi:hypothetical protein|nr:hypothetical protein [Candidatus Baltobacteraceae bacterium]